jgi:hypothetical protein
MSIGFAMKSKDRKTKGEVDQRNGMDRFKQLFLFGSMIVTVLTILVLGSSVTAGDAPNPISFAIVEIEPEVIQVKTYPQSKNIVVVEGLVLPEKWACIERKTVDLRGHIDSGWGLMTEPATLIFIGPYPEKFTVTVIVPPMADTGPWSLTVFGTTKVGGMAPVVVSDSVRIEVVPYRSCIIEPMEILHTVDPGASTRCEVTIWNTGNSPDVFEIGIPIGDAPIKTPNVQDPISIPAMSSVKVNISIPFEDDLPSHDVWEVVLTSEPKGQDNGTDNGTGSIGTVLFVHHDVGLMSEGFLPLPTFLMMLVAEVLLFALLAFQVRRKG